MHGMVLGLGVVHQANFYRVSCFNRQGIRIRKRLIVDRIDHIPFFHCGVQVHCIFQRILLIQPKGRFPAVLSKIDNRQFF